MPNHTSHSASVRRASARRHSSPSPTRAFAAGRAAGSAGRSGDGTPAAASKRRTTCSASSARPRRSRKRTDSGSVRRTTPEYSAGSAPMANAHRHPASDRGMTKVPMSAARIHPTAQNASSHTTIRPRMRAGANSLTSVLATGSSAPSPNPIRKRKTSSDATLHENAAAPVATP
jgi:hypothetical protein